MNWLVAILTAFLRVLLPWAASQRRPAAGDADPDSRTAARLRDRIRRHWGAP
ncbi:MAG: hypothetical protein GX571_10970 [Lentisphaerae bacterium]|jgi:hypothetical protein|nr:hypothetical protein [Lentisphaerota bacterium]